VRIAHQYAKCVVVSIFVNPLQFGANEDFGKYRAPCRPIATSLQPAVWPLVFAPTEADLYPQPQQVTVEPPPIAQELCGAFRPATSAAWPRWC